jgi:hypothetical protein
MLGFAALTPTYTGWVLPPSVREVSRGFRRVTEGVGAESGREMTLAVFVAAATPSDSPSASHLPQEEGFVLRRFASEGCVVFTLTYAGSLAIPKACLNSTNRLGGGGSEATPNAAAFPAEMLGFASRTPPVMAPDATPEDERLYANYGETPFLGGVLSR